MTQRSSARRFQSYPSGTQKPRLLTVDGKQARRSADSLKLARELDKIEVENYRLPSDDQSRKSRQRMRMARDRMHLAQFLAHKGDADGSRIYPGEKLITAHFGWSRATTFRLLDDLKKLRLLEDERRPDKTGELKRCLRGASERMTSEHGTRLRRMNLAAFVAFAAGNSGEQESHDVREQESHVREQESHVREQESHKECETQPSQPDRHLKEPTPTPPATAAGGQQMSGAEFPKYNKFEIPCSSGVVHVSLSWTRKLFRNDRERDKFNGQCGVYGDARFGLDADNVMAFLKLKGFRCAFVPAASGDVAEPRGG